MASKRKTALITGGTRGIGLGIAQALAAEGYNLAVNGLRDMDAVSETIDLLRNTDGEALGDVIYCQADISQADQRENMIAMIANKFDRLDVLVNSAGITSPGRKDMLEADEAGFDRVFEVNLKGPYFLTQRAANWMIRQRHEDTDFVGCIVNISSVSAVTASTNRGDYCMTKAAIGMATKLWATRLAEFGITVYEIRPGIIRTDMTAGVTEKYDKLIAEGLLLEPRWGKPADIGKAVAMLSRGDLPYATGQVLTLDGGLTMPRL